MKTFFIYLISNLCFLPLYFMISLIGGSQNIVVEAFSDTNWTFMNALPFYTFSLIPNITLFFFIHYFGYKWNLNNKLNVLFLAIAAIFLFYFIQLELIN